MLPETGRFLSRADQIIAFDTSGVIMQRGTFAELSEVDGYIRHITRDQLHSDGSAPPDKTPNSGLNATSDTEQSPNRQADVSPSTSDDQADDEKPPATESSIYRYYLSSLKKVDMATFLFFQTLVSFLACFSCMLILFLHFPCETCLT